MKLPARCNMPFARLTWSDGTPRTAPPSVFDWNTGEATCFNTAAAKHHAKQKLKDVAAELAANDKKQRDWSRI